MVTKKELVALVAGKLQPSSTPLDMVNAVSAAIQESLAAGEDVYWHGLGTFRVVPKKGRAYPNFKGGKIFVEARNTVRFDEGTRLKEGINPTKQD